MYFSLWFLISSIFFPIIWYILSRTKIIKKWIGIWYSLIGIGIIHLLLLSIGISFRWDGGDFIFFCLDFLLICIITFSIKPKNIFFRLCRWIIIFFIWVSMSIWIIVFPSLLIFSKNFEIDSKTQYREWWSIIEIRTYTTGDATTSSTIRTSDRYKLLPYTPFEYHIHQDVKIENSFK